MDTSAFKWPKTEQNVTMELLKNMSLGGRFKARTVKLSRIYCTTIMFYTHISVLKLWACFVSV